MNRKYSVSSSKMVAGKSKHEVVTCSTPEHRAESPSRDSDSLCGSEAASPVPFLCTQDGAEGETDVVWNFYTPKADHQPTSRIKNSTPLSTKAKKPSKHKLIEDKPQPKRRTVRPSQKKKELFQDLLELNQNLHELIAKKSNNVIEKPQSGSEEDIFSDSGESSPKSGPRTSSRCLRKNVLSSKFGKPEPDTAMESDDSMNECLIKASQVVEEKILNNNTLVNRNKVEPPKTIQSYKPGISFNMDNDSMDAILNNINFDSPLVKKTKKLDSPKLNNDSVKKTKKLDSPKLNNDSFDSIVGNLNDSALERLSQMPSKNLNESRTHDNTKTNWTVKEVVIHDASPNKSFFGRHNSMPESPLQPGNKPSTSGTTFGRYNSMPLKQNAPGDSPIRCTPDEIKKKHQQAREKLLAKRLLPFTSSQQNCSQISTSSAPIVQKRAQFQPRIASSTLNTVRIPPVNCQILPVNSQKTTNAEDIKQIIERKRQEALMKLRKRQTQNKP